MKDNIEIFELDKNNPTDVYESIRGYYSRSLEESDLIIREYKEATDIDSEGISDLFPLVEDNHKLLAAIVDKLNDVKTLDWFVGLVNDGMKDITEEDLEILKKAEEIQKRIDKVFDSSIGDLDDYISSTLEGNVVLN